MRAPDDRPTPIWAVFVLHALAATLLAALVIVILTQAEHRPLPKDAGSWFITTILGSKAGLLVAMARQFRRSLRTIEQAPPAASPAQASLRRQTRAVFWFGVLFLSACGGLSLFAAVAFGSGHLEWMAWLPKGHTYPLVDLLFR